MALTMDTRQVGDVIAVDLHGRIALGEESAALRDKMAYLLNEGKKKILLNMSDVNYIDSSGLGALVSAYTSARRQGVEIKLAALSDKVSDLMEITRLYTIFDVARDEATALATFGRTSAASA